MNLTVQCLFVERVASKNSELPVIWWTHIETGFLLIWNDVEEIHTQNLRVIKWKEDSVIQDYFCKDEHTDWEPSNFLKDPRLVSGRGQVSSWIPV